MLLIKLFVPTKFLSSKNSKFVTKLLTFNSAKNIQKIAKNIPLSKILVETDSPYLAPSPVRGSVNEPKNCIHTAKFLSKLRNVNFFDLSETLFNNSLTIYDKIKFWKDK